MAAYPVVEVLSKHASEAEVDQVSLVIRNAFADDPFTLCLMGGDLSVEPSQTKATVRGALIDGEVHVVRIGPAVHDIVGVAIWFPPGHSPMKSEEARSAGWNDWLEKVVPEATKTWWLDYYIGQVKQLSEKSLPTGYPRPWYLLIFAVLSAEQGKGYGKVLMEYAKRIAQATCSPIILETMNDRGMNVYQKMGFEKRGEIEIKSDIVHASYQMRLMTLEFSDPSKN